MMETPSLDELKSRIEQIHALLQLPELGLISWQLLLHERMTSLVQWWTRDDPQ
jgi:hypothetical protein